MPLLTPAPAPVPSTAPSALAPVRSAARDALDPAHLRAALRVNPADATLAAALRCGAAVALAIAVPGLLGRPDLAAFAALGALTSLYGRYDPYRRRAALLATVAVLMTGTIAAFTLLAVAGAPALATTTAVALLAAGATAFCLLVRTGPPGATIVVFAAGAGLAGSPALGDLGPRVLAGASGALLAWLVCMAGVLVRPTAPARLAVRRAADAAAVVAREASHGAGAPGTPPTDASLPVAFLHGGHAARAAVGRAREVLADDASWRLPRDTVPALSRELDEIERALDALGVPREDAAAPVRTSLTAQARSRAHGPWRLATARVGVSGLVAGGVAAVAGLGHAAWATMGSTAVLQGESARHAVVRAIQRGAGTVAGALLAWPLLAAPLGFWGTAAVVVVLQTVTETIVGRHYGLAMLTITPMALLMTSLAHPADPAALALDRALDTVLGALVGVLAVVLVHPRTRPRASETPAPPREWPGTAR
ncbi:putative membrane protein YccC [Cellulosimicrobium cellulans]|uniref:FUSC family protein n=1 Tax=Cellulosimicrobium cellulans TaxID=1710 RepID=UPI00195654A9|nr:FUSC family protein [Cellulosimicrobium cellulans]MBM7819215.1 putative membrane protein YccC [Cellulosimicrobium cellulans]